MPKHQQAMVAALIRTIFVQPDHAAALTELARVAEALHPRFPRAAADLRDMAADLLAFMHFPAAHWRQIYSTNPLERLNREIGRRADVVGIFPNRAASLRLLGAVLMEQSDEWAAATRHYFSQESMAALATPAPALPPRGRPVTPRGHAPAPARLTAALFPNILDLVSVVLGETRLLHHNPGRDPGQTA